tara:strand:- start:461 stop:721 length:261 start_codon:yes stop_codon:yes gene_type:complete
MSKIKTLGKFMKNPLKYAANQASCVSKGKKLGLSSSDARNACKPHYKEKGKILSKLKTSKPMEIRKSNKRKRNPEKDVLAEIKGKR